MYSTTVARRVAADRATVYAALPSAAGKTHGATDTCAGTDVEIRMDGVPDGVPAEQNELGTRMALDALARLVG